MTAQSDNIEAIARYIGEQVPPVTPAAAKVRDDFLAWMSKQTAFGKAFDQAVYDTARNYRLAYNRANAVTPDEKAAVEEQSKKGLSTEQLEGQPDRRTSGGAYIPPPPLIPPSLSLTNVILLGGLAIGVGLWVARKVV